MMIRKNHGVKFVQQLKTVKYTIVLLHHVDYRDCTVLDKVNALEITRLKRGALPLHSYKFLWLMF